MKEINEIKKYPSQENTKSIACRIPMSDYVKFMQDAIDKNIKMNDWLLLKIYGNNKPTIGDQETINKSVKADVEYIYLTEDDMKMYLGSEQKNYYLQNFINRPIPKREIASLISSLIVQNINQSLPKEADIEDVRNQLIILIDSAFKNNYKDRKEFKKEIGELLDELEIMGNQH